MKKEVISDKQGIFLTILAIIGTSVIIVMGLSAKKDLWIANILSIFMALPLVTIYARLHHIFTGKDLFDILFICFGKLFGTVISILYIWFTFHIGALITHDFGTFITSVSLPETPEFTLMLVIIVLGIWAVKKGVELLGRWTTLFAPFIMLFIFTIILLLIPHMNINNIRPVLSNGIRPVIKGAFYSFAFPFAETVILTMFFSDFQSKRSPYKIYLVGLLLGGFILVSLNLTILLVLGINTSLSLYFPTHSIATRINIGVFFQRIEIISAIIFILGGFVKMSISLLAACKGIAKIFGCADYRFIVAPIALLMNNLSVIIYDSTMEVIEFASTVSPYYKFPFQVILPIIILIVAEIKKKKLVTEL
ncbi:endospore germination permease [Wukongibacter baidiensis]|uniref:GerAB/ArcD/ProY family transporter n=1 Tax=Wukongibacter baidiensis TaxID=1723361 RepID=UPI003D7FB1C4